MNILEKIGLLLFIVTAVSIGDKYNTMDPLVSLVMLSIWIMVFLFGNKVKNK